MAFFRPWKNLRDIVNPIHTLSCFVTHRNGRGSRLMYIAGSSSMAGNQYEKRHRTLLVNQPTHHMTTTPVLMDRYRIASEHVAGELISERHGIFVLDDT